MTTITTTEELRGVPDGSAIRLRDPRNGMKMLVKNGDNFTLGEYTVTEDMLTAALAEAAIETGPIFTQGQVITSASYEYLVLRVNPDDTADIMQVYDKVYPESILWSRADDIPGPRTTDQDERLRALFAAGNLLLQERRSFERHVQRADNNEATIAAERQSNREHLSRLNADIIAAIDEFDDDDDRQRITNVLREYGMDLPSTEITFRITVSGNIDAYVDSDTARNAAGAVDSIEAQITGNFSHQIVVTEQYNGDEPGDPCEDRDFITSEWAEERLRDAGIAFEGGSISIDSRGCDRC